MLIFPALGHFYFAKYHSFHIVFKVFSSKLVAVSAPIIFHRLDIIYFLITKSDPNDIVYLHHLAEESPLLYAKLALKENGLQDYVDAMNEFN